MRPDRSGFVLPTTLLVMTLLTVMLTAAFTLVSAEYRTTDNSAAITRAQALAEAGLQGYLSMNRQLTGTYDSVRVTMTGGYADVIARRLRDSTIVNPKRRAIWLIRSSGYAADVILIGQLQARRTVAQVAEYHPAVFPAEAAIYAVNGIHLTDPDDENPIMGDNTSGCSGTPRTRKGLITPTGGFTEASPGDPPTGNPVGIDYVADVAEALDSTHIDWAALVAGNFGPDYVVPPSPPSWSTQAVYLVNGDFTLSNFATTMRGILVVTGNLTLTGSGHWHGLIIVGGYARSTGVFRLHGMMITGMNLALGLTVPADTIDRDDVDLYWRACEFDDGIANLAAVAPRRGTWLNTWSTY